MPIAPAATLRLERPLFGSSTFLKTFHCIRQFSKPSHEWMRLPLSPGPAMCGSTRHV